MIGFSCGMFAQNCSLPVLVELKDGQYLPLAVYEFDVMFIALELKNGEK